MTHPEFIEPWEHFAKEGRMADAMEAYIDHYDYVTFPELMRRLSSYFKVEGDVVLELEPHIVLWAGMSEGFAAAFMQLKRERRIWGWPTTPLVYLIDGGILRLPLAKRPPKEGYKKDRWCPITLRTKELTVKGLHHERT